MLKLPRMEDDSILKREYSDTRTMKAIRAFAIVKKENPKLDLNDIYKAQDIKDIHIQKDEKIVEVIIQEA